MKTLFDKTTREELIGRINTLKADSNPQWGSMNVYQMIKHCAQWDEMVLENKKYKRSFMGLLFGRFVLKSVLKDASPMRRNSPTMPEFKVTGNGDMASERAKWIALIGKYESFPHSEFIHPFFGKMTKEQVGYMAYKHADHHLRQFNS